MKIVVTGGEGFVGSHLVSRLLDAGHDVIPTSLGGEVGERLELPDEAGARHLLETHQPDAVIHLAAVAFVPAASDDPGLAWSVNVDGTVSLLQALRALGRPCRFVFVSSSSVYGPVPVEEQPITEAQGPRPRDAYGRSKLAAEQAVAMLGVDPIRSVVVRPFNHTGPGQSSLYALSSFARQIAEIERGEREPVVEVGNLEVRRDLLDVRDVVEAYRRLVEASDLTGTFNVCSGEAYRLRELLDQLCARSTRDVEVRVDPERVRPSDLPVLRGSADGLTEAVGWKPEVTMERTLQDLLESWRHRLDPVVR